MLAFVRRRRGNVNLLGYLLGDITFLSHLEEAKKIEGRTVKNGKNDKLQREMLPGRSERWKY